MTDAEPDFWLGERSEYVTTDFDGRLRRCEHGHIAPSSIHLLPGPMSPVIRPFFRDDLTLRRQLGPLSAPPAS